jgi:hypothetical protein
MVKVGKQLLCKAKRVDGQPCRASAISQGYCFAHSPELAAKAREARSLGGLNKARIVRLGKLLPPRLIPVFDTLESALYEVHSGDLEPKAASAMAALASAMVKVLTSGELEERLRKLEEPGRR